MLQWAREHGCPWDSSTRRYAAMHGQLQVLQWVRENDATSEVWTEGRVRTFAAGLRMQEVLTWLNKLSAS